MLTFLKGDATVPCDTRSNRVIAHVCNDVGAWGRGFVLSLSKRWPVVEQSYRQWHAHRRDDESWPPMELGQVVFVPVEHDICVANMVAQHGLRTPTSGPPIRYDALESCLNQVRAWSHDWDHASVHMPRIGCGLAGGRWEIVGPIVDRVLFDVDVYVYDV